VGKILITTSSFDIDGCARLRLVEEQGLEIVMNPYRRGLTEEEVSALLQDNIVGMIAGVEPLTKKVIEAARNLKVISRCGVGLDSVDMDAARKRDIIVSISPHGPTEAVGELTISLMLNVLRRVSESDHMIRSGQWNKLMGRLLGSQTVGIIGYGRIGKRVAELVQAFGAKVIIHDAHEVSFATGVTFMRLEQVVAEADVVTLHVPYLPSTQGLIDREMIGKMKKGSVLINASRGGIVDEDALTDALRTGHLAGAAIDTFEDEPYQGPLVEFPQAVLTAHMGSYASEAREEMEKEAVENLIRGLAEKGILPKEGAL